MGGGIARVEGEERDVVVVVRRVAPLAGDEEVARCPAAVGTAALGEAGHERPVAGPRSRSVLDAVPGGDDNVGVRARYDGRRADVVLAVHREEDLAGGARDRTAARPARGGGADAHRRGVGPGLDSGRARDDLRGAGRRTDPRDRRVGRHAGRRWAPATPPPRGRPAAGAGRPPAARPGLAWIPAARVTPRAGRAAALPGATAGSADTPGGRARATRAAVQYVNRPRAGRHARGRN